MLFLLKKFISFWLMPYPFCATLIIAGLLASGARARRPRLGRGLIALGAVLLVLFGNKFVSTRLERPLETVYPPIPELTGPAGESRPLSPGLARCQYVVVLGGGHGESPNLAAADKLSASALFRLTAGVRIVRLLPGARLIVSGPAAGDNPSHASMLAQAAVSFGIDRSRILLIDTARDTEDESAAVRAVAGAAPIALVTSSWHMPRAAALFRHAGVDFLPCPTDYLAHEPARLRWTDFGWDAESLTRSTVAVRERIGRLWLRLRGRP